MKDVLLGELIKQRRTDRKMTQEELATGICSHATICRIERGEQFPNYDSLQKILQRLGLDDDLFYGLRSQASIKVSTLQDEILTACVSYPHATGTDKLTLRETAVEKLQTLTDMVPENDHLTQQFMIHCKLMLGKDNGVPYTPDEELELLLKAIRLTVPRFDVDNINNFVYYFNEIKIINHIALTYSGKGEHEIANDIFRQLFKYVESRNENVQRSAGYLPLIAHNYARELGISGRYREAIKVGEKGWQASREYRHYAFLGSILHTLAECYHHLGDEVKSRNLFHLAHSFYQIVGDDQNLVLIKDDARRCRGLELEDYRSLLSPIGKSSPSDWGAIPGFSVPSLEEFW